MAGATSPSSPRKHPRSRAGKTPTEICLYGPLDYRLQRPVGAACKGLGDAVCGGDRRVRHTASRGAQAKASGKRRSLRLRRSADAGRARRREERRPGLKPWRRGRADRVAAGFADEALFLFPAASGRSRPPSRAQRRSPSAETEHCCPCRCSQGCCSRRSRRCLCCRGAAPPFSAAQQGEKIPERCGEKARCRGWGWGWDHLLSSARRCRELALSLSPPLRSGSSALLRC